MPRSFAYAPIRTAMTARSRRRRNAFMAGSIARGKENATAILERLRDGSMPCDGEWPEEQVERFQRWTETGMHE